jgi:hypothetical protein
MVTPPRRLLDRLKPFDYGARKLGIRAGDVRAFLGVAEATQTVILLRSTNPASLQYIDATGYTPKPIDCKAKTAKENYWLDGYAVECAGLVADPNIVGSQAYDADKSSMDGPLKEWGHFLRSQQAVDIKPGVRVYVRRQGRGFFAVDTAPPSLVNRHHGCLMFSAQDVPRDFDPASSHTRAWIRRHMAYIHGDYDLYGIADFSSDVVRDGRGVNRQAVGKEAMLGQTNYVTARSSELREMLNNAIGCEMVQHGEQVAYSYSADDIYVFMPTNAVYVIDKAMSEDEMKGMMFDLFHYVFKTEVGDTAERVAAENEKKKKR